MKRRQFYMVELEPSEEHNDLGLQKDFVRNFEAALLLSLLEKGQLNKWQYDCCMDEIKKR